MTILLLPGRQSIDSAPNLFRGYRHVEMVNGKWCECIENGSDHGRRRADGAAFARALGAEGIVRGRPGLVIKSDKFRQSGRARQRVIHETAAQQLAAGVEDNMLPQGLAD